jgi:hypothetical protein
VNVSRLLIITIFNLALLVSVPFAAYGIANGPAETTLAYFRQVPCLQEESYQYHKDIVRTLSYTRMRAFRAFCSLPEITAAEAIEALQRLVFYPLSFDQVEILETFFRIDTATLEEGWNILEKTAGMKFTAIQAASTMNGIAALDSDTFFSILNTLLTLDESGCWAAKALFNVQSIQGPEVIAGLTIIEMMSATQHMSAEKGSMAFHKEPQLVLELLETLQQLPETDANNIAALFSSEQVTPQSSLFWLQNYFTLPINNEETRYFELSDKHKSTLLGAFSGGSDYLIWKLNNLHSVTNDYGGEIGTTTLVKSSDEQLWEIFGKLHPLARQRYTATFGHALIEKQRYEAVSVLKEATAQARKLTAEDLTSANIYILLSRGSELYDSSFRDILVPILLVRIDRNNHSNLLSFLIETDPENGSISDFIISCAQKGKLTAFFPEDPVEQRKILDLVTRSAFQDEQSLILFAATFSALLEKIQPEVRTHLLDRIISTIQQPDSTFALQLRVILQYYKIEHPDLLSATDLDKIADIIKRYGAVDLSPFVTTDFSRWKKDRQLASLSIFQYDDDGSISYHSNSRNLITNGYKLRMSSKLSLLAESDADQQKAQKLIKQAKHSPDRMVGELYALSVKAPIIVEWYKWVNGIELSHAVAVYQNEIRQQELLKQFLEQKMEMFAQRGHSYWRGEQLIEPMKKIIETGAISSDSISAINRFMSIGSCGGLRIYTQLNKLFNNTIDILATVGTGKAVVNDPYNRQLFEIIATAPDTIGWEEIGRRSASIFAEGRGSDYLQPGSLPAILHKMMDIRKLN